MKIFIGAVDDMKATLQYFGKWEQFKPRHVLGSFAYPKQVAEIIRNRQEFDDVFIDSGAFSFMNSQFKGVEKYWERPEQETYFKRYCDWLLEHEHKDKFTGYACLDVIGNAEETYKNQKRMEEVGLKPIPVFHLTDKTHKHLEEYLYKYDWVAMGGAVKVGGDMTAERRAQIVDGFFDTKKKIDQKRIAEGREQCRVHAFGITSLSFLKKFEFYSSDSVAWAMGAAYGNISLFGKDGSHIVLRISDRSDLDLRAENNFSEAEWTIVTEKLKDFGFTIAQVSGKDPKPRRMISLFYYLELEAFIEKWYETIRDKRKVSKKLF